MKYLFFCLLIISCTNSKKLVNAVADAERSFARHANEKNLQDAFLANAADSAVVEVNGKFVNARSFFLPQPKDTMGKLIWAPAFATISADGQLGYTTGPYHYRFQERKVAFGDYATVWMKERGEWKFFIDFGIGYDSTVKQGPFERTILLSPTKQARIKSDAFPDSMQSAERAFITHQSDYKKVVHPQAHLLWNGHAQLDLTNDLLLQNTRIEYSPEKYLVAGSNDLGVVYGRCTMITIADDKRSDGAYMHVWRKDAEKGWQLLHETIK